MESSEFGEFAEAGIWTITSVYMVDIAGNRNQLYAADLDDLGFESTIIVNN
jgi:hypothetical protein